MSEILIIKTGHSETFSEHEDSDICSLGDVLRTSFLAKYFENYMVTWVTDSKAIPLFDDTGINVVDWVNWPLLDLSKFNKIINLEKKSILLEKEFEGISNTNLDYVRELSKRVDLSYQEKICLLLRIEWNNDDYLFRESSNLGKGKGIGIGLNWKVGQKFPEKSLSQNFWKGLENNLSDHSLVKWQEGFDNLNEYINWIDSLETLISLDSLGAHIGIALNKNVICLFGPTNINDVHMYDRGIKLDISNLTSNQIYTLINDSLPKRNT